MSFSNFLLFYCIVLWLTFGDKWLRTKLLAEKDTNPFYGIVYKLRYLAGIAVSVVMELVLKAYEFLNT